MKRLKITKELDFEAIKYSTLWMYPKTIAKLTNRSKAGANRIQRRFEEFLEQYPKYFEPYFKAEHAVLKFKGETTQYNILCFIHYYQNRDILDAGLKPSTSFKQDIKYLKKF